MIADYYSGFQGDELLHIEAGNNLAFGYMEFPPMIAWLAFIQNLFQSESVFVHHIFTHIASLLILVFVAKTVHVLGGGWKAIFLVLLCLVPVMGRSHQLFQPVVFSQLFWVFNFYFLTQYVKLADRKYLWFLTVGVALAWYSKYDVVFFLFGLLSLLLFKETRARLIQHKFWWNVVAFIVIISPNLYWQYANDLPVFRMFSRLYETQLDKLSMVDVLGGLFVALNPVALLVYLPALLLFFRDDMKRYRVLFLTLIFSATLLALSKGKSYYFYPMMLSLLPFGGVYWESVILKWKRWLLYPVSALLVISGLILLPFSIPLTSLESYLAFGEYAVKEERYSKAKWENTLIALKEVYEGLPENVRQDTYVWAKHYGQAGAIRLMGEGYDLPEAFSLHGSFYLWLPEGEMPDTVIALRYSDENGSDFFMPYFEEVVPVRSLYNPYADEEEMLWQTIFICKGPKQDFAGLKKQFEKRIFE